MSSSPANGRSLLKGLLAGAVAGLAATAAKTFSEKLYPPRIHGEAEPPDLLAEKLAGHPLDDSTKIVRSEVIHWGFGATAGAFYGALVEFYPAASAKGGATFGLTLMSLTHEAALPALHLSEPTDTQSPREHSSEAASHLLYGVVTERVRSVVRSLLGE